MTEKTLLLIVGFLLTGILGGAWGYMLKRRSWVEETKHALHSARYEEGTKFLDNLSELIGRRFFLLQRFLWAIEEHDRERVGKLEDEYFVAVKDWNAMFWRNRNKVRLLVGEEQADHFLDYVDDRAGDDPRSLHYKFVAAHRSVMAAKADSQLRDEARRQVTELNWKCSVFLEQVTSTFLERATKLQLLDVPSGPGAAEQAAAADAQARR